MSSWALRVSGAQFKVSFPFHVTVPRKTSPIHTEGPIRRVYQQRVVRADEYWLGIARGRDAELDQIS
jgi:hypothetical protein